jgi:hypothetical protein
MAMTPRAPRGANTAAQKRAAIRLKDLLEKGEAAAAMSSNEDQ